MDAESADELAGLARDLRRLLKGGSDFELRASKPGAAPGRGTASSPSLALRSPGPSAPQAAPVAAGSDGVEAALAAEAEAAAGCQACPLGRTRIKAVYGVGSPRARVMFVGEGPGFDEDRKGEPFVGKAGQLLDKIMASIGLDRGVAYIANVVKCHPMIRPDDRDSRGNDRPPTPEEIAACRRFIERQLSLIRPRVIVTLGAVAARAMLETDAPISALRGRWRSLPFPDGEGELKILPTYHPAALLRNPALKRSVWEDMKSLKQFLDQTP